MGYGMDDEDWGDAAIDNFREEEEERIAMARAKAKEERNTKAREERLRERVAEQRKAITRLEQSAAVMRAEIERLKKKVGES